MWLVFRLWATVAGLVCGFSMEADRATLDKELQENPDERLFVAFQMADCVACEEFSLKFSMFCLSRKCLQIEDLLLGAKFQLEGYPSVVVFEKNFFKKMQADVEELKKFDRKSEEISDWQKAKTTLAVSTKADGKLREIFETAKIFLRVPSQAEFVELEEISDPGEISVFREGVKETRSWKTAEMSESEISAVFAGERVPLFGEVTRENYELYEYLAIGNFGREELPGPGMVWVCFDAKQQQTQLDANRKFLEIAAEKFRGSFNFVWVDTTVYGEEAQKQIGCKMDDRKFLPALVVHVPGDRPANLRRHRFNGEAGNFSMENLENFLEKVKNKEAEIFFRSKENVDKKLAVPEISSKELATEISDRKFLVGVTAADAEYCGEPCTKLIADLAVIRKLAGEELSVFQIDGLENDPPRPNLFWENLPYLFLLENGIQARYPHMSDFSLPIIVSWLNDYDEELEEKLDLSFLKTSEGRTNFVEDISDPVLKSAVSKALLGVGGEDDENWDDLEDEDEIGNTPSFSTSTAAPQAADDEDWDDFDAEL